MLVGSITEEYCSCSLEVDHWEMMEVSFEGPVEKGLSSGEKSFIMPKEGDI